MPAGLARSVLDAHRLEGSLDAGADLGLAIDQVLIEDATGSMCAMQFEALGVPRIEVPLAVLYVDHNVLQIDDRNMAEHHYLRSFCSRYGVRYSAPGNGISHYLHLERFARPGEALLGADSHSTMAGALGMLALGAGGLEVAVAMAGHGYQLSAPRVVAVELTGRLAPWVEAKDVILELLRRYGVRGGTGTVFEFVGDGVSTLSVTERATICNMIVETGATAAIFPSDERVREWLAEQGREKDHVELSADPGAHYDDHERIDLASIEPLIARPSSPGDVVPVSEVAGTPVVQVCVGSSVNSSYTDLATVAAVLQDRTVSDAVSLTVTPGSRQILDTIGRTGVHRDLAVAGARMLEPICGPCIGIGQAPTQGQASVRTFNRNFPGRSGTAEDRVYLCSPSTAAATALTGEITDPRSLGDVPEMRARERPDPAVVDAHISEPLPPRQAAGVEIVRASTLVPPPLPDPCPTDLDARVGIVVGDDVSTGDMAPDGAIGMSVWSDIEACSRYLFRRIDPDFHARVVGWRENDGDRAIIVGGHNYGQGSSREHAALSPMYLGIQAVVAASFARIHRRNLIAQGIVPLLLSDDADRDRIQVGDRWVIEGVRDAVLGGEQELTARSGGQDVRLRLDLSHSERASVAAGGLLRQLRDQGKEA